MSLRLELGSPAWPASLALAKLRGQLYRTLWLVSRSRWLSGFSALAPLFDSLTGIYDDSRIRRAGAKEARLAALATGQARAKRLAEITTLLGTPDNDELDLRLR